MQKVHFWGVGVRVRTRHVPIQKIFSCRSVATNFFTNTKINIQANQEEVQVFWISGLVSIELKPDVRN